jgi:hypothetical protein
MLDWALQEGRRTHSQYRVIHYTSRERGNSAAPPTLRRAMSNCACRGQLESSVTDSVIQAMCTAYCLPELDQHNQGASLYLPTNFVNTLFVTFMSLVQGYNDHGLGSYKHICHSFSMHFKQIVSLSLIGYHKHKFAYSNLASKHYE